MLSQRAASSSDAELRILGGAAAWGSAGALGHAAGAAAAAPCSAMWTLTNAPGIDMFRGGQLTWGRLKQVFVILFGVGERDTEGIYSLRAFSDDGMPQETIIAFETEDDAQRYGGLLEATMDFLPAVCTIAAFELIDFCMDHGYQCRLEPTDSLLIPPDFNVGITDWERSLRLREGHWAVLAAEPECAAAGSSDLLRIPTTPPVVGSTPVASHPMLGMNSSLARYTGMAGSELLQIRSQLERLLGGQ